MVKLYSNENFPLPVVKELRKFGYNVLTIQETGKAEQSLTDEDVLEFAVKEKRALKEILFALIVLASESPHPQTTKI